MATSSLVFIQIFGVHKKKANQSISCQALEKRETEIRIQFRPIAGNLFGSNVPQNELVVRIQPSEAIYMKVLTKKPGLAEGLEQTELDLTVMDRFDIDRLPDAYERLILDVVKGDKQKCAEWWFWF